MTSKHAFQSIFALIFAALVLAGCAIVDEGAVDYRRAPLPPVDGAAPELSVLALEEKFVPLAPGLGDAYITRDDYYYITLKQAVIQEFWELLGKLEGAEIAIVATVFEIGDVGADGAPVKFDFSPSAVQRARVIFYSDDVERGQALNLSQLPIYGPVKYREGNAVAVQLYILELDQISERTKALLKEMARLASLAASGAASPAAGQGVDVLTNLALAFLNGNHDDMIFRYDMTFAPQYQARYVPQDYLTEGERIFVRQKERDVPFDWNTVRFDPKSGRLLHADGITEYRDNSYVVMDVLKLRNVAGDLSQASFQRLSELIADIRNSDSLAQEDLDNLRNSVTALIGTVSAERSMEASLRDIFDPLLPKSRRAATALDLLQKFKSSLADNDPAAGTYSDALIDRGLRFMWKRIGEAVPDATALTQSLTVESIRGGADLNALAGQIAAIYD